MSGKKKLSARGKKRSGSVAKAYDQEFTEVIGMIRESRRQALRKVNTTLIDLYWRMGGYLSRKVNDAGWGRAVVRQLANHIQRVEPDSRGFSAQNLWRMKQLYETYTGDKKLSALLRELPWTQPRPRFSI